MTINDLHPQIIAQKRLERAIIAFFVLCALFVVGIYISAPSIYTQVLMLSSTATDRYPWPATLLLVGLLLFMTLVMFGVVRHWRWLFWLLLLAFGFSILQVPAGILQLMNVLPDSFPAWYTLTRIGVAVVEVGLAVWMIWIYRSYGIWAMGKKS
jgi:hypothetical protein